MVISTYHEIRIDKDYVSAEFTSKTGECKLNFDMSKAKDHPLSRAYDKSISFRSSDITLLMEALADLRSEIDTQEVAS